VFALKGIISSSPLQAAGLSNGVNTLIHYAGTVMDREMGVLRDEETL
jgi:hypothetical protein